MPDNEKRNYPRVGTIMYCVKEHFYYEGGRAAPKTEYTVFCGEVTGYLGGQ